DQATQLAVSRRIHAHEITAAEECEVALRRHDLAEVGREGGGIGEHALHVGVAEHLPDTVVLVVMYRPGVALLPEPGQQGIQAWRGMVGGRCRGLHGESLPRRPLHATPAATAGKAGSRSQPRGSSRSYEAAYSAARHRDAADLAGRRCPRVRVARRRDAVL